MLLVEFAAQGVRGVSPAGGRATLRPGYNVVAADGAVLRRLLEALLYPDPRDGDALPRAAAGPANAALRAGLTLVGNDRVTYRLVRDFAAGAQLHRFDPEKRAFALVSQELAAIGAALQQAIGVPPPGKLGALLTLSAADLPSKAAAAGGGAALPGVPQRASLTPEQATKRAAALRGELERARVAEKLQYQLDGLQAKLFKLEETLKGGARLAEGLEGSRAVRGDLEAVAQVAASLGDPEAKLAAYERARVKHDEAVAKIAAEREAMDAAGDAGEAAPVAFWRDPRFWAGVGAGALFALGGIAGAASDLRYVALLDIPAFGWSAWVALRWVGAEEGRERGVRRRRVVDDWERKVEAQFEKDAGEVRAAVKALGVSSTKDLVEALARVADADATVADWTRRHAEWEASPEAQGALAERAQAEEELRGVEAKLSAEAGGFVRDARSVEAELARVEAEAAAPAAPAAASAPAVVPAAPPRPAGEPLKTLAERAAAELGGSPTAALRAVSQKAGQALAGLSFQRLQAIQVDDRGNLSVQTGGRPVAALSLPPADRDLLWLALKIAFLEQSLAATRGIALCDDAFAGLSDGARRFAARLLKQVAKPGQLLHATTDPAFKEAADHAAG